MSGNNLRSKTVSGMLWSFTDLLAKQGVQFIIQIILARLLLPEYFGLIGLTTVFIAISQTLIDSGFTQALIREKNANKNDYSTVFYFNFIVSLIVYGIIFTISPFISNFYNEDQLTDILRVVSLSIIINSLAIVPRAMLTKEVDFKSQTKVNASSSILSGSIAIILALLGYGVWSLVLQTLLMSVFQTAFLFFIKRWIPSLVFNIESFKKMFGFGSKLLISGIIDTIYKNIYFVIIGKQYTSTQLGFYTNASKLRDYFSQTLTSTIQRVTYPILSSIQDEQNRLKNAYRNVLRMTAFVMFPMTLGLIAIADPLIRLLFGNKWLPMVPYFQLLAFASMLYPIHAINLNILQVKGRSDLFLRLEIIKKSILTFLITLAVILDFGIIGLIFASILSSYIGLFVNTYYSGTEISYPLVEQVKDIFPAYAKSLLMGAMTFALGNSLNLSNLITIIIQIILGVLLYITLNLKTPELVNLYELLKSKLKK